MLIFNVKSLLEQKKAREKRKINFKIMSEECGIPQMTLSRISGNHEYNVSRIHIEKLLKYFDCTPNELLLQIDKDTEKNKNRY